MKSVLLFIASVLLGTPAAVAAEQASPADYVLFDDTPMATYWYSACECTAPAWVGNSLGKLPVKKEPAYTPGSSIELKYITAPGGTWRAKLSRRPIRGLDDWDNGVYVQTKPTPFKKPDVLHLRIYCGNTAMALVPPLPNVRLMLDKDQLSKPVALSEFATKDTRAPWALVSIPITKFDAAITSAEQVHGIAFDPPSADDGKEHTFYLDQIDLRPAKSETSDISKIQPTIVSSKGFERHVDIAWQPITDESIEGVMIERAAADGQFKPIGYRRRSMSRFTDYVGPNFGTYSYRIRLLGYDDKISQYSETRTATTRPFNDEELLDMVQEACGRYYWDGAEPNSGMTLESIPGAPHMVATGASGFGIMSLVVSAHRNHIPREQVVQRMLQIVSFLEKADRFHGVWAHYQNGKDGHPILFFGPDDNGGDLVETSFLMQGLLTARQFFDADTANEKQLRERITKLWESTEWNWHRKENDNYLLWHWSPTVGYKINHRLIGWNESMITYLLAIASPTHGVPPSLYYSGWASQEKLAQEYRGNGPGKMYSNGDYIYGKKLDVGGFGGGPLFFIHYNFMGVDPHGLRDKYTEYFDNSKAIAEINLRYCQANPAHHAGYGDDGWGLTASDGPTAYNPDEPRPEGDKGKLTPTGAVASIPYLPTEGIAALKNYYRNQGHLLWGEYGFRDAYNLDERWVNDLYMGLNQAPMVVMIENYRSGMPWKVFGSNPEIQKARQSIFK